VLFRSTITAVVETTKGAADGVILAQAGRFGGWSLYLKNGRPTYVYNFLGLERTTLASRKPLPAGKNTIRVEFDYDGGGLGKGGDLAIFLNDGKVAGGRIARTQCCAFSADERADVGVDDGTPVSEAYKSPFKFTGEIKSVTVDLKPAKKAETDDANPASAARKARAD
jgi:arylsulfatase